MPLIGEFFNRGISKIYFEHPDWENLRRVVAGCGFTDNALKTGKINIEEVMSKLLNKFQSTKSPSSDFWQAVDQFKGFVSFVIRHSSVDPFKISYPLHRHLVSRLGDRDCVLSVNYDVLMDHALWDSGRWFPHDGYGLSILEGGRMPEPIARPFSSKEGSEIQFLKLHGSISWGAATVEYPTEDPLRPRSYELGNKIFLSNRAFTRLQPYTSSEAEQVKTKSGVFEIVPLIVPPILAKPRSEEFNCLSVLWQDARKALSAVSTLVIIGCSLREADNELANLLQDYLGRTYGGEPRVDVVDPSEDAVKRARSVFGEGFHVRYAARGFSEYLNLESQGKLAV